MRLWKYIALTYTNLRPSIAAKNDKNSIYYSQELKWMMDENCTLTDVSALLQVVYNIIEVFI